MITLADFTGHMKRLGAAFKPVDAAKIDAYYEALRDIPADILGRALAAVIRSERFFPTVVSIRAAADLERRGRPRPLSDPGHVGAFVCPSCEDSGWLWRECDGSGHCGVRGCSATRYAHRYVLKCDCFSTNSVVQSKYQSGSFEAKGRDYAA